MVPTPTKSKEIDSGVKEWEQVSDVSPTLSVTSIYTAPAHSYVTPPRSIQASPTTPASSLSADSAAYVPENKSTYQLRFEVAQELYPARSAVFVGK